MRSLLILLALAGCGTNGGYPADYSPQQSDQNAAILLISPQQSDQNAAILLMGATAFTNGWNGARGWNGGQRTTTCFTTGIMTQCSGP